MTAHATEAAQDKAGRWQKTCREVDLTVEETLALFDRATFRVDGFRVFMKDAGAEREVCRTDLYDDCRTSLGSTNRVIPDMVEYYRKKIRYGARLTEKEIFVIDDESDH